MNNFIEMDYDVWLETYRPILNHIDSNASFDGMMFETYGDAYSGEVYSIDIDEQIPEPEEEEVA